MSIAAYPGYRVSSLAWIPTVPDSWEVVRFKYILGERDIRSTTGTEQLLKVSQYTGITKRRQKRGEGGQVASRAESLVGYRRVERGELVVNIMLAWNGSLGVSPFDGIVSPAYCVYRCREAVAPRYVHYLLRSHRYRARIRAVSTGVVESRLRLYTDGLYRIPALVPPLSDQAAIVRFVDHADRRIQRYIRAKERLIELLEEEKEAIIHQAVTGQIDVRTGQPYPAYKDSGVGWLGQVPEHWEERPLKRIASIDNSGSYGAEPEDGEVALPVATTAQIAQDGRFDVKAMPERGFSRKEVGRYRCRTDDILVVKSSGSIFNVVSGKAGIVDADSAPFAFSNFLLRVVANDQVVNARFLFAILSGYLTRERVKRMVSGSTYPNLKVREYISASLPLPPLVEQVAIVRFLHQATSSLMGAVRSSHRQIRLFHEYRTRLIADVVTGKLDVREAAASLPETDPLTADDPTANPDTQAPTQADIPNPAPHPHP